MIHFLHFNVHSHSSGNRIIEFAEVLGK